MDLDSDFIDSAKRKINKFLRLVERLYFQGMDLRSGQKFAKEVMRISDEAFDNNKNVW